MSQNLSGCFIKNLKLAPGWIKKAIEVRNDLVDEHGLLDQQKIRSAVEFDENRCKDETFTIGMSSLALDLYMWNQLETEGKAFDGFLSIMDQAPPGSSARKLRDTDLAMDQIKGLVIGPGFKMSKSHLEERIETTGEYMRRIRPEEFNIYLIPSKSYFSECPPLFC